MLNNGQREGFVPLFRPRTREQDGEPSKDTSPLASCLAPEVKEKMHKCDSHALRKDESERRKRQTRWGEGGTLTEDLAFVFLTLSWPHIDSQPLDQPVPPEDAEARARAPRGLLFRELPEVSGSELPMQLLLLEAPEPLFLEGAKGRHRVLGDLCSQAHPEK